MSLWEKNYKINICRSKIFNHKNKRAVKKSNPQKLFTMDVSKIRVCRFSLFTEISNGESEDKVFFHQ